MSDYVAHDFQKKTRTEDVLISENVDFAGLLLSENVLAGLARSGFEKPSPIQLKAIPVGRCGLDLIVQAKSGTGKTVVFSTIALESLQLESGSTQVLVMAPTREIAVQIWEVMKSISCEMPGVQCQMFIGGLPIHQDKQKLKNCHIAIGTPGRVKQLIEKDILKTESIRLFILDEADKLLEESFQEQINWIYSTLPDNKQMVALSATYPEYMAQHLTVYMRNPTFVRLNSNDPALLGIKQYYVSAQFHYFPHTVFENKVKVLVKLLSSVSFHQCLVFSNLQTRAQNLCDILNNKGWPSECIAGCLEQQKRMLAMEKLKTLKCRVLISTDLTSRGIDAENVNLVVNLDIPHDHETYLHRIGRAGRFGSFGASIILVSGAEEEARLKDVEAKCNTCIHPLPDPIPADLADRDVPISLGDLVTTTKIITRSDDEACVPNSIVPGTVCEKTTSEISQNAGDNKSLSGSPSSVEIGNVSYADKCQHGDTELPSQTSVDGGYSKDVHLTEKALRNVSDTESDSGKKLLNGHDTQPTSDSYKSNTEGNWSLKETNLTKTSDKSDNAANESKITEREKGVLDVPKSISETEIFDIIASESKPVDCKETTDKSKQEVQTSSTEKPHITTDADRTAFSLESSIHDQKATKEKNILKKTKKKKNKPKNVVLQEEFGGGESFEICNTDMVILERPGSTKQMTGSSGSLLPESKPITPRSLPNVQCSLPNVKSSLPNARASSAKVSDFSCRQDETVSDAKPSYLSEDVTDKSIDITGRKKKVAVRRRKVAVTSNPFPQNENQICKNDTSDKKSPLIEKSNTKSAEMDELPKSPQNENQICKNYTSDKKSPLIEKSNTKSAEMDELPKSPSLTPCGSTQPAFESSGRLGSASVVKKLPASHTYLSALEDYEQFLKTWDECSLKSKKADISELLILKCKNENNQRCRNISLKTVNNALKDADIKYSLIHRVQCASHLKDCVQELSTEIQSLSLSCKDFSDSKGAKPKVKQTHSVSDDDKFDRADGFPQEHQKIPENIVAFQMGKQMQKTFRSTKTQTLDVNLPPSLDSRWSSENDPPPMHQQEKTSVIAVKQKKGRDNFSRTASGEPAGAISKPEATQGVSNRKTGVLSNSKTENYALSNGRGKSENDMPFDVDSPSESLSSNSLSVSSSSYEASSSDTDSSFESESCSSDDESQNYEHFMQRVSSSRGRRSYRKKTSGERDWNHWYPGNRWSREKEESWWGSYPPHTRHPQTHRESEIPETHLQYYSPFWDYYHYSPEYMAPSPPSWNYPGWHNRFPYVRQSTTYPCYPLFQFAHPKATMDSFLHGRVDGLKMKEFLKSKFDYLKYMKMT